MQYNFIKFAGNYPRGDTKIAINKSGLIRLSSGFCRTTNATSFKYAVLFYDSTNKAIAVKFTNVREDGILRVTKDKAAATLSAKLFLKANNLYLRSYSGRYDWKKLTIPNIGEIFVIELSKK